MYRFAVYLPENVDIASLLAGATLVGPEGVPVRGEIRSEGQVIRCDTRSSDAVGLSLLWPVAGFGSVQLETTRLTPRLDPYHLHVELARHRLMRITMKREEWGLFDYPGMEDIAGRIDRARDHFVEALKLRDDPQAAARAADKALREAIWSSEEMSRFHASVFLSRRTGGASARGLLGVSLPGGAPRGGLLERAREFADFVRAPLVWRDIQPKESTTQFEATDAWIKASAKAGLLVRGGPLLNFGVPFVPDWMYIWENDFETIVEFVREHIRRTVQRYAGQAPQWIAASGLHADNVFPFSFEQLIELTRLSCSLTRQFAPRSHVILELTQPWGEYHARNPRTVAPLVFAEMAVQSGIPFDAFGIQFLFGLSTEGFHQRDLLQVSSMLDRLANLGRALHVTAVGVPSASRARDEFEALREGGCWHGVWTEGAQADWLAAVLEIALSKPFVESVCLHPLADSSNQTIPSGGVLRQDLTPKPAVARLIELRRRLASEATR